MSRINNVSSLIAQRILGQSNQRLNQSLERLSTGLRINRGSDDPAGLIVSEKLRADRAALNAAVSSAERADQVTNIAEGGLQEISSLLIEMQSLVTQAGSETGLSTEEKEANQQQVDAILQTIDRISSTTSFNGTKVLNGSLDFTVSDRSAAVSDYQIFSAKFQTGDSMDVDVVVTASAQNAGLFLSTDGDLDLTDADSQFVIEVGGAKGTRQFSFSSGTTRADMETTINAFKDITGVSAKASGTGLVLKSTGFGSDQFVSFNITDAGGQAGDVHQLSATNNNEASTAGATDFAAVTTAIRDEGQDVAALVNGAVARGQGKNLSVNSEALSLKMELSTSASQSLAKVDAMTITGGGAMFNLGPEVNLTNQVRLGVGNMAARKLGSEAVGFLSDLGSGSDKNLVDGNINDAQEVVAKAINQVSTMRGRLGSFQSNVLQSTIRSLNVAIENTSAAESAIRDTDFAAETAELTRSQILVQVGGVALSIANSRPQSVLQLLN